MTTRLTDNERTLLSAYRDGELSHSERAAAEKLLAGSVYAREYLDDLRSLGSISRAAFDAPMAGVGSGIGGRLSGPSIQSAARMGARAIGNWAKFGLVAAVVSVLAVITVVNYDDEAPSIAANTAVSTSSRTGTLPLDGLRINSSSLLVPAITHAELIDFAVTGCLPIDSSRDRYLSIAQASGEIAIKVHDAPGARAHDVKQFDLRALPGLDSLERAIRTSLLQSENNCIAVRDDLPSLRLRVIEELQDAANQLPADVRRSISATRFDLDREYLRLSSELRQSHLDARRNREDDAVRYHVIAGTDLQKQIAGSDVAITFERNDPRVQTINVSVAELGTLSAQIERQRVIVVRQSEPRMRVATLAQKQSSRRSPVIQAGNASGAEPSAPDSTTISFETVQQMQSRGETLDGVYSRTEEWIIRAERILQDAERIRRHIELLRTTRNNSQPNASEDPPSNGGSTQNDGSTQNADSTQSSDSTSSVPRQDTSDPRE